jgi:hypothetical protein
LIGKLDKLSSGEPVVVTIEGRLSIRDMTKNISIISQMQYQREDLVVTGRYPLRFPF